MAAGTYSVLLDARLARGADRNRVVRRLATRLDRPPAQAKGLLECPPVVVRRGASPEAGERGCGALRRAGVACRMRPEAEPRRPNQCPRTPGA